MQQPRRIVVCVDDFGLDPHVNTGALVLADLGRVSAIGCMVGAPFWHADAAALRRTNAQALDVGVHLDLTQHPLDAGIRRPLWRWIAACHAGAVDRSRLRREIGAQLDAFARDMGRPPAFVDGHEHVHQLPVVRDLLVAALLERGWRPWLRSTHRPAGLRTLKAMVVESLGASALRRLAHAHGFRQNERLLGVYGFQGDAADYLQRVRGWLALARDGDVLVCHPAIEWPHGAAMPAARCNEYAVLAGATMAQALREAGVTIGRLLRDEAVPA